MSTCGGGDRIDIEPPPSPRAPAVAQEAPRFAPVVVDETGYSHGAVRRHAGPVLVANEKR